MGHMVFMHVCKVASFLTDPGDNSITTGFGFGYRSVFVLLSNTQNKIEANERHKSCSPCLFSTDWILFVDGAVLKIETVPAVE